MSRIVKKRGVVAWMGAGASLRAGSTCEGGNVQNACLSFTLRAVRAYVWVWGALGAREINVTHYGGGFAFIWEKEKAQTARVPGAPSSRRLCLFLFSIYNARQGRLSPSALSRPIMVVNHFAVIVQRIILCFALLENQL